MKVVTRFNFDEAMLRTVRAAHGRGGVASRKECQIFIDRALRDALAKAPDPRPVRKRLPKPAPAPVVELTDDQEAELARARRSNIRRLFYPNRRIDAQGT